jgi:hypothetical protein
MQTAARRYDNIIPMAAAFKWNDWNLVCCTIVEIESLDADPGRGYPRHIGDEKLLVAAEAGAGGSFG